jgi:hypothetical protein
VKISRYERKLSPCWCLGIQFVSMSWRNRLYSKSLPGIMKYDTRQRETLYVSRSHANGAKGNVLILACSVGTRELLYLWSWRLSRNPLPRISHTENDLHVSERYLLILADWGVYGQAMQTLLLEEVSILSFDSSCCASFDWFDWQMIHDSGESTPRHCHPSKSEPHLRKSASVPQLRDANQDLHATL